MTNEVIERSYLVTPPVVISVSNIHGSIKIIPSSEPIVSIHATKHLGTGNHQTTIIDIGQAENGAIYVSTHRNQQDWRSAFQPCQVDYVIYLPHPCQLTLTSINSRVEIIDLQGEFNLHTIHGNITVKDLAGMIKLSTISGEISGNHLSGSLDLRTISGNVLLHQSAFSMVNAETVSANISLETSISQGPYQFKSLSGDIKLYSPPDTHCNINMSSMSGTFKSGFSTTFFGRQPHAGTKSMMVQDGGPEIQMNSLSGNLWILTRDHLMNKMDPFFRGLNPHSYSIIKQIADGKLSIEDGVNILNIQRMH